MSPVDVKCGVPAELMERPNRDHGPTDNGTPQGNGGTPPLLVVVNVDDHGPIVILETVDCQLLPWQNIVKQLLLSGWQRISRRANGVAWLPMDTPSPPAPSNDRLVGGLSWAALFFTVAVILGGAVVRATDSGAGCGESWPRCEGQLIPVSPEGATVIEFTHRTMTAVLGVVLIALVVLVLRRFPKGHRVRTALWWSIGLFFAEVIIGAVLVLFGWVEDDASIGRVIAVNVHLVITFLLLGSMTLLAHFASGGQPVRFDGTRTRDRLLLVGAVTLLIIGASGALNALSDTLFPAGSVIEGIRDEFGPTAPFLLRVRTIHPVIAIAGGGILFMLARAPSLAATGRAGRLSTAVQVLIGVQFLIGLLNVALLTPVETQVIHLLMADALWILWVLFGAELLGSQRAAKADVREVS